MRREGTLVEGAQKGQIPGIIQNTDGGTSVATDADEDSRNDKVIGDKNARLTVGSSDVVDRAC